VGAVGDRGRRAPEQPHLAAVGQRRAGDEVDEDFGGRLIEPDDGDVLAGLHGEPGDPERAEAAVVLGDVRQFENRPRRCGHDSSRRFTSSTMRDEASSASTSIFRAATLQAMAPYASIPCTTAGITPVSTLAPRIAATIVAPMASVPMEKTGLRAAAIRR